MPVEDLLHLLRRDVGARANNDLLEASSKPEIAIGVALRQVAGV
jgi:hypothetical protein